MPGSGANMGERTAEIYARRFTDEDVRRKDRIWREIVAHVQRYFVNNDRVIDIGCDRGHFIRQVAAREKWAIDLNDMTDVLGPEVRLCVGSGLEVCRGLPQGTFDVVFMSNYLEHLPSAQVVIEQVQAAGQLLVPETGRLIILQPNIRFTREAYWDFIDHKVPLTEKSLAEAAELGGLRQVACVPRFLPYTTKSALPQQPWLVKLYLAMPPIWRLLGQQTLWVGKRP